MECLLCCLYQVEVEVQLPEERRERSAQQQQRFPYDQQHRGGGHHPAAAGPGGGPPNRPVSLLAATLQHFLSPSTNHYL